MLCFAVNCFFCNCCCYTLHTYLHSTAHVYYCLYVYVCMCTHWPHVVKTKRWKKRASLQLCFHWHCYLLYLPFTHTCTYTHTASYVSAANSRNIIEAQLHFHNTVMSTLCHCVPLSATRLHSSMDASLALCNFAVVSVVVTLLRFRFTVVFCYVRLFLNFLYYTCTAMRVGAFTFMALFRGHFSRVPCLCSVSYAMRCSIDSMW